MYLAIFFALSVMVSVQGANQAEDKFMADTYDFAVFDEDDSEISRGLVQYLSEKNEKITIEDDVEAIQDEVYNRNVNCVMRIPKGFEEAVKAGKAEKMLEITAVPGTMYGQVFEGHVNGYVQALNNYLTGGFSLEDSMEKTRQTLQEEAEVKLAGKKAEGTHSKMYYFFNYVPYIFIAICVTAIGPILLVFHKKEVRERIASSAYPEGRINLEVYLGMVTTGVGLFLVHCCMVLVLVKTDLLTFRGLLFAVNEITMLITCLGITFLVGQIVKLESALSMAANVIGLGICFLGGVFVPLEMLGDNIIKAAHFLPSYWYIRGCGMIDGFATGDSLVPLFQFWGIQLLFAAAFICIGAAYNKVKR